MNNAPLSTFAISQQAQAAAPRASVLSLAVGLALAAGIAAMPAPTLAQANGPKADVVSTQGAESWVPNRLLVQPRPGLPEAEFDKIIKKHGGKQVDKIEAINVRIIQLPPQASEKAVAALLAKNKHLKFAEVDSIHDPDQTNDPYYGNAWHLPLIGADKAWAKSSGSTITIAVLDTGVESSHPDLKAQLVPGWNIYDNNSNTEDVYGHGTKVAGTAAAATNNGVGVAAIAGGARIMPVRISSLTGGATTSNMAKGVTWAADRGARVANISYSGARESSAVHSAADYMRSKGGLVVVSAGNSGGEEMIAASNSVIAVSATTSKDSRASWSSYGNYVDVAAPGASIWSTTMNAGYSGVSGTSFASPAAAATVALMMAANPKMAPGDIEKNLFATAKDIGTAGWDKYYGHGRIDAAAAVAAVAGVSTADTTAPKTTISSPTGGSSVKDVVAVDVSASDNIGVSRVELRVNGKLLATDTSAPYGFSWDSKSVADGEATVAAYAYDAAGNYATDSVKVSVANSTQTTPPPEPTPDPTPTNDTTAPKASISSPSDGTRLTGRGNVEVAASASDDTGVVGMALFIDGELVGTSSSGDLSYRWNINKLSGGTHTLTIDAIDAAGNKGSHTVKVTR